MDLGDYTEPCLLHTVRSRYLQSNKLYTQIGSGILVSLNPFCERKELFSAKMAKLYQSASEKRSLVQQ